jgi:hypothetical protein
LGFADIPAAIPYILECVYAPDHILYRQKFDGMQPCIHAAVPCIPVSGDIRVDVFVGVLDLLRASSISFNIQT